LASLDALAVVMLFQVLDFLAAYYPDYLCCPCLATLIEEAEGEVWEALVSTGGMEITTAVCLNCRRDSAPAVRFKRR
jgi:hypothetical protein